MYYDTTHWHWVATTVKDDLLEADADADADAEDGEVSASLHTASAAFCSSEVRGDTLVDSFLISQLPSRQRRLAANIVVSSW